MLRITHSLQFCLFYELENVFDRQAAGLHRNVYYIGLVWMDHDLEVGNDMHVLKLSLWVKLIMLMLDMMITQIDIL